MLLVKIDFKSSGSIIYFEKVNLRLPELSIPSISSKAGFFSIFLFFSFFSLVPGNLNELSEGADSWLLWASESICVSSKTVLSSCSSDSSFVVWFDSYESVTLVVLVIWLLELDVVAWAIFWLIRDVLVALVEVVV